MVVLVVWPLVAMLSFTVTAQGVASSSGRNGGFAFDVEGSRAHTHLIRTGPRARVVTHVLTSSGPPWSWCYCSPDWSPNGRWLVWSQDQDQLTIARANGTHRRVVFDRRFFDVSTPAWGPGGHRIAFIVNFRDVFVIRRDGTHLRHVTRLAQHPSFDVIGLDWSARGWIAAASPRGLVIVRPDGIGRHRISRVGPIWPDWAPHGHRLAYVRGGNGFWVARADGTHKHRIAIGDQVSALAWAPDGSRIAYLTYNKSGPLLRTVAPNGAGNKLLSRFSGFGLVEIFDFAWRPLH
jgi:dipeptidyl aminopeptidase/acylaminoacyl peptidase